MFFIESFHFFVPFWENNGKAFFLFHLDFHFSQQWTLKLNEGDLSPTFRRRIFSGKLEGKKLFLSYCAPTLGMSPIVIVNRKCYLASESAKPKWRTLVLYLLSLSDCRSSKLFAFTLNVCKHIFTARQMWEWMGRIGWREFVEQTKMYTKRVSVGSCGSAIVNHMKIVPVDSFFFEILGLWKFKVSKTKTRF